jgi:tetratricopeptide (TPR) repeat protein
MSKYGQSESIYKEAQKLVAEAEGAKAEYDKKLFAELLCASGVLAKKRSKFQEAIGAYTKAMKLVSKSDPEWPQLLLNLADANRKVGKHSHARQLYQEALAIVEKRNGRNNHPLIAEICNALGVLEKKHGNYGVALDMYSQSLRVGRHFHGESYSNAGVVLTNIGDIHRKKGEYTRAEVMYKSAITQLEIAFGPEHIEVADALNSLGLVNKKKARYDDAKEYYEKALKIAQKSFKNDLHYKKGIYLANLGDVHRKLTAFSEALKCYEASLQNIEGTMGHDNSEVADVLHSSGLVKHQLEKYEESVKLFDEALSLVTKEFGDKRPTIPHQRIERHYKCGMYLCNKGLALAMLNKYDPAYDCLLKSLSILRSDLGPKHVEVADVHAAIADVCLKISVEAGRQGVAKKIEEAERHLKEALEIAKASFGESHTKTQQYESLLFICQNYASL